MYRRYNYFWLSWCAAVALLSFEFALELKPLAGDLTRLGGYAESDFGWHGTEEVFSPPLARPGNPNTHYDIVVIGDSFSLPTTPDRQTRPGGFWTDFLAEETGMSVGVFDVDRIVLDTFIEAEAAQRNPPDLIILEVAERTLRDHLATQRATSCLHTERTGFDLVLNPLSIEPRPVLPSVSQKWSEQRFGQAIDYMSKNVQRAFGFDNKVVELPLSRLDLFSSMRPSKFLFYEDDLHKANWTAENWHAIRCRTLALQSKVEAGGKSRFLVAVAPDKSSAYAAYLPSTVRLTDSFEEIAKAQSLHFPRIDLALKGAIAAGTRDVYLPNDTHWGSVGSKIAAITVVEYLRENASTNVMQSNRSN